MSAPPSLRSFVEGRGNLAHGVVLLRHREWRRGAERKQWTGAPCSRQGAVLDVNCPRPPWRDQDRTTGADAPPPSTR